MARFPSVRYPSPQPAQGKLNPTADEFASWCEHPVTGWVARAYLAGANANCDAWRGMLDVKPERPLDLAHLELKTRADAYRAFLDTTYPDYLRTNDPQAWSDTYGKA